MDNAGFVDLIFVVVLILSFISGLRKGLIRQVLMLLSLLVAFMLALLFAGGLGSYFSSRTSISYTPAMVLSFVLIFLGALYGFHLVSSGIEKVIHLTFLGWVDRLAGALLGLIVGMVISSLIIAFLFALPLPRDFKEGINRAPVSSFLEPVAPRLFNMIFNHGSGKLKFERILRNGEKT